MPSLIATTDTYRSNSSIRTSVHGGTACWLLSFIAMFVLLPGCRTRSDYRRWADCDVSHELAGKQIDPRWQVAIRPVTPDPRSRMADFAPPDCGPLPPDDPAAHVWMENPGGFRGWPCWHARGDLSTIEFDRWLQTLPRGDDGVLEFTQPRSMELALLHSRDYQDQIEILYFRALALTLEKFEFSTRWFLRNSTFFNVFGTGPPGGSRRLNTDTNFGFAKNCPAGGQLLVDLANSFVWEFSGDNASMASSGLLISFVQPLLRGAWREVRLEPLAQSERDLLYTLREFVRFRRRFYVNVVGSNGYLGLLALAQAVRNQEVNLEALERNLLEYREMQRRDLIAAIQVDQVFQQVQQGRLSLLAAQQALANALDQFKLQLGLPPDLQVRLDEEALKPFELENPQLDVLRKKNEQLRLSLVQFDRTPTREIIQQGYQELESERKELAELYREVTEDWQRWDQRLQGEKDQLQTDDERALWDRERSLADRIKEILQETGDEFQEDDTTIARGLAMEPRANLDERWKELDDLVAKRFREQLANLVVAQNQIRVFSIQIERFDLDPDVAVSIARRQRLDLMNQQARVVDGYRRVEVAADALQAGLNVRLETRIATDPTRANPVAFEASANTYRLGVDFDGPLTRFVERNAYRAAQIAYQQERRAFMALEDNIVAQVRADLRSLEFSRFSFEIAREQYITATRQVDQAQTNLRTSVDPDSSVTNDLLNALQGLLNAKNNLIGSWVQYQTSRMNLYRDLDAMDISSTGVWINEHRTLERENEFDDTSPVENRPVTDPASPPVVEATLAEEGPVGDRHDR